MCSLYWLYFKYFLGLNAIFHTKHVYLFIFTCEGNIRIRVLVFLCIFRVKLNTWHSGQATKIVECLICEDLNVIFPIPLKEVDIQVTLNTLALIFFFVIYQQFVYKQGNVRLIPLASFCCLFVCFSCGEISFIFHTKFGMCPKSPSNLQFPDLSLLGI